MHAVATWRGPAIHAFAIALFGLVGAAGCTLVGDSLTGVSLTQQAFTDCVQQCNDDDAAATDLEQQTHQESIDKCQLLAGDEKDACLDTEGARHAAAMIAIQEARKNCLGNCHRQGGGSSN